MSEYTLHIFSNGVELLGLFADDPTEYSAIYKMVDGKMHEASNLMDSNRNILKPETAFVVLSSVLAQPYDKIYRHEVTVLPDSVLWQFQEWWNQDHWGLEPWEG